eukprot:TRINITY_DN15573_c0_g1_i1.p1 TRINITY_DN15573_c0_g1~~TRINITY_DN15573_c0_g1_i1.p1  ORF type:complete len:319 (-),score=43.55 TRINITY_DN15573_c0_g1_i1:122-1078(-)
MASLVADTSSSFSSTEDSNTVYASPYPASLLQFHDNDKVSYVPRSAHISKLSRWLGLYELTNLLVYKATFIEFIGTGLLTYVSCASVMSSVEQGFWSPRLALALIQVPILAIFIFSTARPTGGHLNPMITIATVFTRLTTPVRGTLYVIAQATGAICGAALLRVVVGDVKAELYNLGGCSIGTEFTLGRAILNEMIFGLVLLFVAFGTALDTGMQEIYGPVLAPFFIATMLGIILYSGAAMGGPTYLGPGVNPARCFGPAVALGKVGDEQLVWWFGPIMSAVLIAVIFLLVPPQFAQIDEERKKKRKMKKMSSLKTVE